MRHVVKYVIPKVRCLTPLDKEDYYYYQQLLLEVPHRSDVFLSSCNKTKTFHEECILRGIFAQGEDAEEALEHAARRNFDPERIQAIARRMLQEQICDHNIINSKLRGLNIGEIDINHNEQLEVEEESIAAGCVPDQHVHFAMKWKTSCPYSTTADSIQQDHKTLATHIEMLTPSQLAVFSYIKQTSGSKQILAFVTGGGGCGKSFFLHTVRRLFEYQLGKSATVLGTSSSAAVLINAQTIHRFFHLDANLNTSIQHEISEFLSVCETCSLY